MILESLSFTRSLYAFDFDGTLSKIVRNPSDATLSHITESLLRKLSELAPVAVLSGRSIEDLRRRLPFEPAYLVGNHGLELLPRGSTPGLPKARELCRHWKQNLSTRHFGSGVEIEDKTYSLAIHYRKSRNKKKVKQQIHDAIATLIPEPRVILGKAVVNILPLGAPHKGLALLELMKRANTSNVFYMGDDDTDEDVFSLPDDHVAMTVRVGERKTSHARFFIQRQSQVNQVLRHLVRFHCINRSLSRA